MPGSFQLGHFFPSEEGGIEEQSLPRKKYFMAQDLSKEGETESPQASKPPWKYGPCYPCTNGCHHIYLSEIEYQRHQIQTHYENILLMIKDDEKTEPEETTEFWLKDTDPIMQERICNLLLTTDGYGQLRREGDYSIPLDTLNGELYQIVIDGVMCQTEDELEEHLKGKKTITKEFYNMTLRNVPEKKVRQPHPLWGIKKERVPELTPKFGKCTPVSTSIGSEQPKATTPNKAKKIEHTMLECPICQKETAKKGGLKCKNCSKTTPQIIMCSQECYAAHWKATHQKKGQ